MDEADLGTEGERRLFNIELGLGLIEGGCTSDCECVRARGRAAMGVKF